VKENAVGTLVVHLLKGFLIREDHPRRFEELLQHRHAVRDHVAVIGLDLEVNDAEGFAYVKQRESADGDDGGIPKLSTKRALGFATSLLLALLRKRLGEHDASSGDPHLVLSRDAIHQLMRPFFPDTGDALKAVSQMDSAIDQVVKLGFLRQITDREEFTVRRILIAFVTATWLANLASHLDAYRRRLAEAT
jgi:hypothetical protein